MYVSYQEAARSKLCSISDIRHAVTAGLLRGDESFISWDLEYEQWLPKTNSSRVIAALNARRFDSKAIYTAKSHKPVSEVHEMASRRRKGVNGFDWFVIPLTPFNVELLFGTHDGNHDAPVLNSQAEREVIEWVKAGRRVYQTRVGLPPESYAGKNLYPSQLCSVSFASVLSGESKDSVEYAIGKDLIRASSYCGESIVHLDSQFESWSGKAVPDSAFMTVGGDSEYGSKSVGGFWDFSFLSDQQV